MPESHGRKYDHRNKRWEGLFHRPNCYILLQGGMEMIVIDRTRCVSCGACNAMAMTFKCIQATPEYELYEEPPVKDRDYVQQVMRDCWAKCIYLSGGDWED